MTRGAGMTAAWIPPGRRKGAPSLASLRARCSRTRHRAPSTLFSVEGAPDVRRPARFLCFAPPANGFHGTFKSVMTCHYSKKNFPERSHMSALLQKARPACILLAPWLPLPAKPADSFDGPGFEPHARVSVSMSLYPDVPCSLVPSIPCSLNPSTPQSLDPLFPCSLVPSFPRSLVPSFPRSLVPWFPCSLDPLFPRSLNPSIPRSLVPLLPRSLNPSIPCSLAPSFPRYSFQWTAPGPLTALRVVIGRQSRFGSDPSRCSG